MLDSLRRLHPSVAWKQVHGFARSHLPVTGSKVINHFWSACRELLLLSSHGANFIGLGIRLVAAKV
jgi:hypothetical protein